MSDADNNSAQQILRDPGRLEDAGGAGILLITQPTAEAFNTHQLNPTQDLQHAFIDTASSFLRTKSSATFVPHHPGRKPDRHEVATAQLEDLPQLRLVARQLDPLDVPLFDPDSDEAEDLKFYVVSLRIGQQTVHFVRSMTIRKRLGRSSKLAAVMTGAAFDRLTTDPLLFDSSFDAMIVGDTVLLFNIHGLERSLGVLEQTRRAAVQTLTSITTGLRIRNFGELEEAATSDINMIAKLRSVRKRMDDDPAYSRAMTMDRIVPFAKQRPDLRDILAGPPGNEEFVFHRDPQRRWRILKLLDDDYLHSEVTDLNYEANSKSAIP